MATFSVISRDDPADDLLEADAEPLTQANIEGALDSLSRDVATLGGIDDESMPRVLMELPDLAAMSQWSEQRWSNWGNRIFWVGIVLGSVVALYLIWQPRRAPAPQREAAPTWHGQSAPAGVSAPATALPSLSSDAHQHEHSVQREPHDQAAAPSWPAEGEANPTLPTDASESPVEVPAAAPADSSPAPSFDEWSGQRQDAGAVYTARSGEGRLDGGAPRSSAGEAIPTGKIKSVVTP
jgi:hypothetical protein